MDKHRTVSSILAGRLSNMQVVRGFWQRQDTRGAVAAVKRCGDQAVAVDVLGSMIASRAVLSLDVFLEWMPVLEGLLGSQHAKYSGTAIDALIMFLRSFGGLVKETLQATPPPGIDLKFEERRDKCISVKIGLMKLRPLIERHRDGSSRDLSRKAFDLYSDMTGICGM